MSSTNEEQIALVWKNLTVYRPISALKRWTIGERCRQIILRDVSGLFKFNQMSAIMGPSGAGKSTLLQCLFGSWIYGYKGKIFRNKLIGKAAFITQQEDDHLFPCLSVIESIFYASRLKGSQISDNYIVEQLLDQLDLNDCRTTYVNCCSGGQRKRLAIAQELAAKDKPKMLFIDEPTSGLDSNVSHMVLSRLRELSEKSDIAIVATIHQPSYKILKLFDQMYVISKSGRCLYHGRPDLLRNYLSIYNINCPIGHNPADIAIDTAAINTQINDDNGHNLCCTFFANTRNNSNIVIIKTESDEDINKVQKLEESSSKNIEYELNNINLRSLCNVETMRENNEMFLNLHHILYLLRRSFLHGIIREPLWFFIRTILYCAVALMLSLIYDGTIGQDDGCLETTVDGYYIVPKCYTKIPLSQLREQKATSKNVSFLFFNLLFLMFAALMPTILTFPSEIRVFLNEHRNGWYSTGSYYWAKTLTEFWIQLILPYFYCLFTYWSTNQIGLNKFTDIIPFYNNNNNKSNFGNYNIDNSSRFKKFVSISILSSYIAQGIGFFIGSIFITNFNISIFVATTMLLFNFLFSGYFVRPQKMGNLAILTYLSFIRFAFESILLTLYGENRCSIFNTNPNHKLNNRSSSSSSPSASSASSHTASASSSVASASVSASSLPLSSFSSFSSSAISSFSPLSPSFSDNNAFPSSSSSSIVVSNVTSTVIYRFELDDDQQLHNFIVLIIHLITWRLLAYFVLYIKVNPRLFSPKVKKRSKEPFIKDHYPIFVIIIAIIIIVSFFSIATAIYLLLK